MKTLVTLLYAVFITALFAPVFASTKPVTNARISSSTPKAAHKTMLHHKTKRVDRSQSTLVRGVNTSAEKATKFTKRTLTVPQKDPQASAKPKDRTDSTLVRGVTTSANKATKFAKQTLTVPQKNPEASVKPKDRTDSTLVRGVNTSAAKTKKFLKKTFTAPHKKPVTD